MNANNTLPLTQAEHLLFLSLYDTLKDDKIIKFLSFMPNNGITSPLNINNEREVRLRKMSELLELGTPAFPAQATKKHSLEQALSAPEGASIHTAGRIITKRDMGKLTFCHLQDETAKMQIALKKDVLDAESYKMFLKLIDSGDIIEVQGEKFITHKGEPSLLVKKWRLLTKAVRPLPDKFHGLSDEELRFRKRYLDLIVDPEQKEMFVRKSHFWNSLRQFLAREGFLEVETPVLETTTGGADATPFVTHHNALGINVYLRISMGELWQKRLMVGGFEKTFEIGRQFRNEGLSREHLQDYTQMEFYWAYADYEKGMDLVQKMYQHVMQETWGTLQFTIGEFGDIDMSGTWPRMDYAETVKEMTGIDIFTATEHEMFTRLDELNVKYDPHTIGRGRIIDLLWKYCRKKIKGPVFLINHPVVVSPLAKRKTDNPELTERYQIIIAGSEQGNGYSELNDPIDQAGRFAEQGELRKAGDTEAQMEDTDFVEALEYGMPPTTGFGFSERLFSFLENKPIRECVIFPLVRPEGQVENTEGKAKKTMVAHAVILDTSQIPLWSKLNAAAHLCASLGAREGRYLIRMDHSTTADGERIPMNIQHAIMMKNTADRNELLQLKRQADGLGLMVTCFTEEMRDSSNDEKVKAKQEVKKTDEIGFLGVLVFGEKKMVEKLTDKFTLFN